MLVSNNTPERKVVRFRDMKPGQVAISTATGRHVLRLVDGIVSLEISYFWPNGNEALDQEGQLLVSTTIVTLCAE